MKTQKKKRNTLIFALIGSGIVLVIGLIFAGVLVTRALARPVIGFRDIHESTRIALTTFADEYFSAQGTHCAILTIDPSLPCKTQAKLLALQN